MLLFLAVPRLVRGDNVVSYKYQDYVETGDRIRVRNHNARAEVDFGVAAKLSVRGVIDTITGATPTGQPAPAGSDQVPLSNLEDERKAVVVDGMRVFGPQTLNLQYAYSTEDDYVSDGYAISVMREFNEKNTQIQFGFAYTDDDIQPAFFAEKRRKISRDFILGVTQLLDPNTVLTVNLSHGLSDGYLSDPYKLVQKSIEIVPGFPLPLTFAENRPGSRDKTILYAQLSRYFERARGSIEASARFYTDSHGIDSDTLELAWFQKLGESWMVSPHLRYYRQGQADYYHADLDNTAIIPVPQPEATGPFYSSDYRLSQFDATTFGLKLVYKHGDRWSIDMIYERYDMRGRDGVTSGSAYPTANIYTIGANLWF